MKNGIDIYELVCAINVCMVRRRVQSCNYKNQAKCNKYTNLEHEGEKEIFKTTKKIIVSSFLKELEQVEK